MAIRTKTEVSDALLARLGLLGENGVRATGGSARSADITLTPADPVAPPPTHGLPARILPSFSRTTLQ